MMSHSEELLDERKGLPSASGIESLFLCNGKFLAEKGLPDVEYSESKEGTIRHSLAEMDMPVEEIEDDERAKAIQIAKSSVASIKATTVKGNGYVVKEQRMWLRNSKGVPFMSGKPDYVEIVPQYKTALIVDYKMLYGEHSPAHANAQLFTLAAMVMQENKNLQECYVALVTPMLDPPFSVSSLKRDLVKQWAQKLYELYEQVQSTEAKRTAGPKQCKYCRALPFCPEARQLLDQVMERSIEEISKDPDELSKVYAMASMYEKFAASIKSIVRTKLKDDPESVTGLKLGRGMKIAKYDTEKAISVLQSHGFDIDELHKFVKLSEKNLVDVWAQRTGESKANARKSIREAMKEEDALQVKEGLARVVKKTKPKEIIKPPKKEEA